jgi:hypothetical protein
LSLSGAVNTTQKTSEKMLQRDKIVVLTMLVGNDRVSSAWGGPYGFEWHQWGMVVLKPLRLSHDTLSYKEAGHDQPIR